MKKVTSWLVIASATLLITSLLVGVSVDSILAAVQLMTHGGGA